MTDQPPLFAPEALTIDGTDYVRAYPIAEGRCPHCGSSYPYWHPARVIGAAQRWFATHGRSPSRTAWKRAHPETPSAESVDLLFGQRAWSRMLELAGLPPAPNGAPKTWTKAAIIDAMLDFVMREQRWPTKKDWGHATPTNPHYSQAIREFGGWNAVKDAARGGKQLRLLVDSAPIADAVRGYLAAEGSVDAVAELAAVGTKRLYEWLSGKRPQMEVSTADRILMAIDRPDVLAGLATVPA